MPADGSGSGAGNDTAPGNGAARGNDPALGKGPGPGGGAPSDNETGPKLRVAVVATQQPWRSHLQSWITDHTVGITLSVVREPDTLSSDEVDVVVFDDVTQFATKRLVTNLRAKGIAVVGVHDPTTGDSSGGTRLGATGITELVEMPSPTSDLLAAIERAIVAESGRSRPSSLLTATPPRGRPANQRGVYAVLGTWQTAVVEVAAGLAHSANRRAPTIMIDGDEIDPGVASRFMLALSPNIIDYLRGRPGWDRLSASLGRHIRGAEPLEFAVLCGMARRTDDQPLTAEAMRRVIFEVLQRWSAAVVVCRPETMRRSNQESTSDAIISVADHVVVVAEPDPVGALKALDQLAELTRLPQNPQLSVVFYGKPRSKYQRSELENHIRSSLDDGPVPSIVFAPTGPALTKQRWNGAPPSHRLARSLVPLITGVAPDAGKSPVADIETAPSPSSRPAQSPDRLSPSDRPDRPSPDINPPQPGDIRLRPGARSPVDPDQQTAAEHDRRQPVAAANAGGQNGAAPVALPDDMIDQVVRQVVQQIRSGGDPGQAIAAARAETSAEAFHPDRGRPAPAGRPAGAPPQPGDENVRGGPTPPAPPAPPAPLIGPSRRHDRYRGGDHVDRESRANGSDDAGRRPEPDSVHRPEPERLS